MKKCNNSRKSANFINFKDLSRNSVLFSWLLSYCLVFLTAMILSGGMYFVFQSNAKAQLRKYNALLIDVIMKQVDKLVGQSIMLNNLAAFDKSIPEAIDIPKGFGSSEYFVLYQIQDMLAHYSKTTEVSGRVYIYLDKAEIIVTTDQTISPINFYNQTYVASGESDATSFDEWIGYLKDTQNTALRSIHRSDSRDMLLCIKRLSNNYDGKTGGAIVFEIETSQLDTLVAESEESIEYAILDANSVLTCSSGVRNMDFSGFVQNEMSETGTFFDNGYFYQSKTSMYTSITYIALIKAETYYRSLVTLQWICIVLSLILFAFMTVVVFYTLSVNYMPLKSIIEEIKKFDSDLTDYNEYDRIKNVISEMEKEHVSTILKLEDQTPHVQTNMLTRLLKGSLLMDEHEIKAQLKQCGIEFPGEYFAVIITEIRDFSGLFSDDTKTSIEKQHKTVRYVIKNVTEELSQSNNNLGFLCDLDETLILLISFAPENFNEAPLQLEKLADFTTKFFQESLSISLSMSISNVYRSIKGINMAYNEALEANRYNLLLKNETVISAANLQRINSDSYYCFSFEKERQLLNFIKTGDMDSCKLLLDDIFRQILELSEPPLEYARCLAFDMVGTMMKLRNEMADSKSNSLLDIKAFTDKLLTWDNMDALKSTLISAIEAFCNFYNARKSVKLKNLVAEVLSVEYANPNLNVNFIADTLKINRSYLSRVFKEEADEVLLDFINRYRVGKAKELLGNSFVNIENVAQQVGYCNSKILARHFKKFEGMTPSQYRKIQHQD